LDAFSQSNYTAAMKYITLFSLLLVAAIPASAQLENENTMSVLINGVEYKTEPRRIKIGNYGYITGNQIGPDKSLRIWMGSWDGREITDPGTYLIIDAWHKDTDKHLEKTYDLAKYKGVATIKYVEETKSPRMEYHMGLSQNGSETMEVAMGEDGYLELTFDATLTGSWWKEKTSATVFGGVGRLVDKMEDKAVTEATGYDQDIDPEGWGYKKQKEVDSITLKEAKIRLKMQ
jgi:hypothetical protein